MLGAYASQVNRRHPAEGTKLMGISGSGWMTSRAALVRAGSVVSGHRPTIESPANIGRSHLPLIPSLSSSLENHFVNDL
jgi:hypothetical protein